MTLFLLLRIYIIFLGCSFQLTVAYYALLEVLFISHIVFILNLDMSTFMYIAGSLEAGLKALDTNVVSQVCTMFFTAFCSSPF